MADYNVSPYWDTTEEEFQKNYKRVLAYPGRNPQARELTVIQGLTLKHLENLARTLFDDGQIIEGCEAIVSGTTVTITTGKIYAGGLIHSVPETTVAITGTGTEIIGLKLTEEIITENEDNTLRDPAQGYENYDHPGMHRIKTVLNFVVNDDTAIPLWTIVNGILQPEVQSQNSTLYRILAERTYDESGNYRVYGLNVNYSKEIDSDTLEFMVTAGKAYIKGWQILRPSNTFVEIPKAKDTRSTLNEPHTYHAGTDLYELIHQPVSEIVTVTATVQVGSGAGTGEAVVKGVPNGIDPLAHESVIEIVEVWDATHGTYAVGTDYVLTNNSIDWSPSGAEPAQGDTYYVTYKYIKNMVNPDDFVLTEQDGTYYIDFSPAGDDPVDGTTFFVDYNWYLARYDIVYLDKDNNIGVISGKSDAPSTVKPPDYYIEVLPLALIYFNPNSTDVEITEYDNYRLSMEDLHQLYQRVVADEYNLATLDLSKQAQETESSIYLRGIFTDNFLTLDPVDIGNTGFTANIDLVFNWLQLASTEQLQNLEVDTTNTTANIANDLFAYIPYTENVIINQTYATEYININPYATFQRIAVIKTQPSRYYWTNNEYYDVYTGASYPSKNIVIQHDIITHGVGNLINWYAIRRTDLTRTQIQRNIVVSTNYAGQRIATFVPQITVRINGYNFYPDSDNLTLYVNNNKTNLTPIAPTVAGTESGTIKSNSDGTIQAEFTIPQYTHTGIVNLTLKNDDNIATYNFIASGIIKNYIRIRKDIISTIHETTITRYGYRFSPTPQLVGPVQNNHVDPIAQTFSFDTDTFITKIDLYFKEKSATEPILLEIRDTNNGYPSNGVFYSQLLQPDEINISDDATIPTTIVFDNPILCLADQEYAITLTTTSDEYKIWIARGGNNDITSGTFVGTQPYTRGVLFASSNNTAWTAMQDSDLKFILYKAEFTTGTDYYLYFNELTGLSDFSRFIFNIEQVHLPNTDLDWEYSIDSGSTWHIFYPNDIRQTDIENTTTKILIRAKLSTDTADLSPIIRFDAASLVAYLYDTTGDYLTNTVDTEAYPYSEVKVIYKAWLPSGTTAIPYFSTDAGTTWLPLTLQRSFQVNSYFWQYEYLAQLTANAPNIDSSNATVDGTSGSLADSTTYYYIFTATNSEGETIGCAEFSVVVNTGSTTNSIVFDLTDVFDEHTTGFKVYRSTASGSETLKYIISGTPTSWTDDGSDTDASTDVPPTNNTAFYTADSFKGKITLSTSNQTVTPRVIDYIAIFKEAIP